MKRKKVITLITAFVVGLIGLVILQSIWIETIISDRKIVFRREVNDAFEEVDTKFHRSASIGKYERGDDKVRQLYLQIDSVDMLIKRSMFNTYSDRYLTIKGKAFREWILAYDSLTAEFHKAFIVTLHENSDEVMAAYYHDYGHLLDFIISEELAAHGIDQPFEYGIYDIGDQTFLYQKGDHPEELMETRFRFIINPADVFFSPKYLLVYFPKELLYLFYQIRLILFICIFLTIIITAIFAYAVMIIFQQRESIVKQRDFSRNMTHEFRTPLTTINLSCDALNAPIVQNSEQLISMYVNIISKEAKRLQNMVEKILVAIKANKSGFDFDKKELLIENIISDSIWALQLQINEKKAVVNTSFLAKNNTIKGDPVFLTNAFMNIIDNALKYSASDCIIQVTVTDEEEGVLICFEDNGLGISKTQQKQIFDKLYRSSSADVQKIKGFGLGLNYVKMVIENHGGSVRVESEVGKWTKFYIYLPK